MATTTLQTLWRLVANEIGEHQVATVTTAAVGPDPGRWLISDSLRSNGGPPRHVGHFVQLNTGGAGNVRIVNEEPSFGGLQLDLPLSTIAIIVASAFETTWPLPIATTQGIIGIGTVLGQAMREVWYEDVLDLAPAAAEYTVDLSDQSDWLDSEERVQRLAGGTPAFYDPPVTSGYPQRPAPWRYGEISFQAGAPTLRLTRAYLRAVDAATPAQLGVIRPVYSLVNGTTETTTGPSASTDTVGGDPAEIVGVAKLKAYRYLATARHLSAAERATYAAMVDPQDAWVRANVRHYLPRDEMPQQAPAVGGRAR